MRRQWWWVVHQTDKHRPQWPSCYNSKAKVEPQGSSTHLQSTVTISSLSTNLKAKVKANQAWMQLGCKQYFDRHPSRHTDGSMPPFQIDSVYTSTGVLQTAVKKGKSTKLHKVKLEIPLEPQVALTNHSQFWWIKRINNKLEYQNKARGKSTYGQH